MAAPPRVQSLIVQLPEDTKTSPSDWFGPVLPHLNQFMGDTQYALQGKLTRAQNFASQVYVLDFTTGAAAPYTATFNCTLTTQPERIDVVKKEVLSSGGSFTGATECHAWTCSAGKTGLQVQLNDITGLNPTTHYRLTLHLT